MLEECGGKKGKGGKGEKGDEAGVVWGRGRGPSRSCFCDES